MPDVDGREVAAAHRRRRRRAAVTSRTARTRWVRSSGGTSMSELLGLGVADGESRWIGVRRHQAVLVIAGFGLIGEWITQAHGASIELVIGRRAADRVRPRRATA